MLVFRFARSIVTVLLALHSVYGAVIPEDSPPRPKERRSLPNELPHEHAAMMGRRQVVPVDTVINICFDCDLACVNAIAASTFKNATNYFNAVLNQLNLIYDNSQLPLQAVIRGIYTSKTDFVLDPFKNFTTLDQAMDLYWEGNRIAQRQKQGCYVSMFVTEDPIFLKKDMPAGMAYVDALCSEWGYGISRFTTDINAETARVAHEISHMMNVNHVDDGELTYTDHMMVMANCFPDYCPDPTGQCITEAALTAPAPTHYSYCGRATYFAWRQSGGGQPCLPQPVVSFFNPDGGSGDSV